MALPESGIVQKVSQNNTSIHTSKGNLIRHRCFGIACNAFALGQRELGVQYGIRHHIPCLDYLIHLREAAVQAFNVLLLVCFSPGENDRGSRASSSTFPGRCCVPQRYAPLKTDQVEGCFGPSILKL